MWCTFWTVNCTSAGTKLLVCQHSFSSVVLMLFIWFDCCVVLDCRSVEVYSGQNYVYTIYYELQLVSMCLSATRFCMPVVTWQCCSVCCVHNYIQVYIQHSTIKHYISATSRVRCSEGKTHVKITDSQRETIFFNVSIFLLCSSSQLKSQLKGVRESRLNTTIYVLCNTDKFQFLTDSCELSYSHHEILWAFIDYSVV